MPATKRKLNEQDEAGPSKRSCTSDWAPAAILVNSILANRDNWTLPEKELVTRQIVISLAEYARALQLELAAERARAVPQTTASMGPVKKTTREELEAAAEKIRRSTASGICKQMTWKPTCATGRAKFSYDGVCADPELFAVMMKLDGPPTWKMKKFSIEQMESIFGSLNGKVRYAILKLTKDLNVRYSDGEFKISGTYGK